MIRLGALGDVARTLPAFRALRGHYPEAYIAWLVEPKSAGVLEGVKGLDELLVFRREELTLLLRSFRLVAAARELAALASRLRSRHFDLVLDFHAIAKSGVLSLLTRAPLRVSYAPPFSRELSQLFSNRHAQLAPPLLTRFERNAGLVEFLGIAPHSSSNTEVDEAPALREAALSTGAAAALRKTLSECGAAVVIHPGSSEATPYKRYPAASYAAVARELFLQTGLRSIVSFGPSARERGCAQKIVEASDGAATLAPETPSVMDLAALFAQCRLFIGGDSGPLHVASLAGTPVVQILGPTNPTENRPYAGTPSRSVRVALPCSPCRRGCSAATCMSSVAPSDVVRAARELLQDED